MNSILPWNAKDKKGEIYIIVIFGWVLLCVLNQVLQQTGHNESTFTEVSILLQKRILNYIRIPCNLKGIEGEKLRGVVE